jgi:hypothetical protein
LITSVRIGARLMALSGGRTRASQNLAGKEA